jgi:hypothetical protein
MCFVLAQFIYIYIYIYIYVWESFTSGTVYSLHRIFQGHLVIVRGQSSKSLATGRLGTNLYQSLHLAKLRIKCKRCNFGCIILTPAHQY